jgi:hypothetical protein
MERNNIDRADKIIKKNLVGNVYSEISVGDWWALRFSNGYWIVSQEIISPAEENLNKMLENSAPPVLDGIDPEYVAKSIIIHRNMRKEVTNALINKDGSLKLFFDNDWEILFPSTTDIVDWQWCLNKSGNIPYDDFIVACFNTGTIDLLDGIKC